MISGRQDLLLGLLLYFGLDGARSVSVRLQALCKRRERSVSVIRFVIDAIARLTNVLMRATGSGRTRTPAGETSVSKNDSLQGIVSAILVLTCV